MLKIGIQTLKKGYWDESQLNKLYLGADLIFGQEGGEEEPTPNPTHVAVDAPATDPIVMTADGENSKTVALTHDMVIGATYKLTVNVTQASILPNDTTWNPRVWMHYIASSFSDYTNFWSTLMHNGGFQMLKDTVQTYDVTFVHGGSSPSLIRFNVNSYNTSGTITFTVQLESLTSVDAITADGEPITVDGEPLTE